MEEIRREQDHGSTARSVFCMCALVAAAIVFNLLPDKVGSIRLDAHPVRVIPMLAPGFAAFLPRLNVWWALSFSLHAARLILGRWTVTMRWLDVVAHLFGACVLGAMAAGDPFLPVPGLPTDLSWLLALACLALLVVAGMRLQQLLVLKPVVFRWEQGEQAPPIESKGRGR
jgi:hypothetical protein